MVDCESKKITVYERRVSHKEHDTRTLSFQAPADIPQEEALKNGFAVDGNSYSKEVTSYYDPRLEDGYIPLFEALLEEQREIVDWLGKYGYKVTFR